MDATTILFTPPPVFKETSTHTQSWVCSSTTPIGHLLFWLHLLILQEERSLLTGLKKVFIIVVCEKMFLMFSQNFLSKVQFQKNILIDNHFKLFTNNSEVSALPADCLFLDSYPVSGPQNRSILHSISSQHCMFFLPFQTFNIIPQQFRTQCNDSEQ